MAKQNGVPITYLPSLDYTDEQMFFIAFGQVSLARHVCAFGQVSLARHVCAYGQVSHARHVCADKLVMAP